MHTTAAQNAKLFKDAYLDGINRKSIVEIGSQNVNGSIREIFNGCMRYTGVDYAAGPGVDLLLEDPYKLPFESSSVDVIICSSVFEHVEFFWLLFLEILRVLKDDGLFYLNAPSNGSFHRYPVDSWRFYPDAGKSLSKWATFNNFNCILLESYVSNQEREEWNDFVAIFLKNKKHKSSYASRITKNYLQFKNGLVFESIDFLNFSALTEDQINNKELISRIESSEDLSNRIIDKSYKVEAEFLLASFLERPFKRTTSSEMDSVIQGWAIPKNSSMRINLIIIQDEITQVLPFNMERRDAINKISPERNNPRDLICGFKYSISNFKFIKVGLECAGNIIWILSREREPSSAD